MLLSNYHVTWLPNIIHGTKKIDWKPSSGRSQENERYKRLKYKRFVQVTGLCGPLFLSYLLKRLIHLCRALYGDAILVYCFGPPIWPPEINKNIWSSLFLQKLFLFTRELAYMRINISSNTWNGYTAENQEERLFSTRQHSYFGVTHCKNSEVQIAVFSKWNMLREWKLVQRFIFCLSST